MVIGIVVDDTVFLLTAWQRARLDGESEPRVAAVRRIGPAIATTTLALIAGLTSGLLSQFQPIWTMSLLSIGVIATALLIDLLLLPTLLPAQLPKDNPV